MMHYLHKFILKCHRYIERLVRQNKLNTIRSNSKCRIAESIHLGPSTEIYLETERCSLVINDHFYTRSFCTIRVGDAGELTIHEKVFLNNGCSINCMHSIEIGENVMFGEGVKIYDHNHEITKAPVVTVSRENLSYGKVVIGKNSWLGANVTVLKGVTIGENVVIGANCLIFKSIPDNSIVKNGAGLDIVTIKGNE
jgi:acetyltransferase-like isoleucine patch superfamily enzyme